MRDDSGSENTVKLRGSVMIRPPPGINHIHGRVQIKSK